MSAPEVGGPAGVARSFAEALLAGDARRASRCFDPHGVMLSADGTEVAGHEGIAGLLSQIANPQTKLRVRLGRTVKAGPVALSTQIWERDVAAGTGASTARLVLHEAGGRWSIFVAAAFWAS